MRWLAWVEMPICGVYRIRIRLWLTLCLRQWWCLLLTRLYPPQVRMRVWLVLIITETTCRLRLASGLEVLMSMTVILVPLRVVWACRSVQHLRLEVLCIWCWTLVALMNYYLCLFSMTSLLIGLMAALVIELMMMWVLLVSPPSSEDPFMPGPLSRVMWCGLLLWAWS